jgi:glucan phosphoethanolaminetransferase (alkaline phosphatase superfamily)
MIQRIQSVFLLILVIAMVSLLFLPLWAKTNPQTGEEVVLTAFSLRAQPVVVTDAATVAATASLDKNTMAIAGLAILISLVALYEIFQYKSRFTQIKLGLMNSLLLAALLGTIFYYSSYVGDELVKTTEPGSYQAGFYLPILGLIVNSLANRFIKRDEDLVRSVDRLR